MSEEQGVPVVPVVPEVGMEPEPPTEISPEQFIEQMAFALEQNIQKLADLEKQHAQLSQHHQITIALMKGLADMMGLELHQERMPDNSERVGWKKKLIVPMAPGNASRLHLAR